MTLDSSQFTKQIQTAQQELNSLVLSLNTANVPGTALNFSAPLGRTAEGAREVNTELADTVKSGRGLIQVMMMGLEAASTGSLRGVLTGMRGLGNTLGEIGLAVGAVGGALAVGWNIGSRIEELTGLGEKFWSIFYPVEQQLGSIRDRAREATAEIIKMGNQRMDALRESMKELRDTYAETHDLDRTRHEQGDRVKSAQEEADLAKARATQSGTDLIREEAKIRAKYAQKQREDDLTAANKNIEQANTTELKAHSKVKEMEQDLVNKQAAKRAAEAKAQEASDAQKAATQNLTKAKDVYYPGITNQKQLDAVTEEQNVAQAAKDAADAAMLASLDERQKARDLVTAADKNLADAIDEEKKTVKKGTADRAAAEVEKQVLGYKDLAAQSDYQAQMKKADAEDAATKAQKEGKLVSPRIPTTRLEIASDRFAKIGLFVGGGGVTDLSKRTATATEKMAKTLDKYLPKLVPQGNAVATWEG